MLRLPRVGLSPVTFLHTFAKCNKHKSYRIKYNLRVNRVEDLNFHFIWRSMLPIRKRKSGHESEKRRDLSPIWRFYRPSIFIWKITWKARHKPREKDLFNRQKHLWGKSNDCIAAINSNISRRILISHTQFLYSTFDK